MDQAGRYRVTLLVAARHPDRVTAVVYLDCFDTADGLEIHNKNFPLAFFAEPYRGAFVSDDAPKAQQEQVDRFLRDYGIPLFESRIPKFRAALPGARIVVLKRTNHGALPFQRREEILAGMEAFFGETGTGR